MTPQQYLAIARAAHRVELAQAHFTATLIQAGLDPAQSYRFDDTTMTIEPIAPAEPVEPPPGTRPALRRR
jgi:hypothetical protein